MKKKITNIIEYVIIALLGSIIVVSVVVYMLGFTPVVVTSGSMEPTIKTGSLAYYKRIDSDEVFDNIDIGTIITFKVSDGGNLTHAVKRFDEETDTIVTQSIISGSAEDAAIKSSDVLGIYAFSIPTLGYIIKFVSNIYFIIILILVMVFIYLGYMLYKAYKEKNNNTTV